MLLGGAISPDSKTLAIANCGYNAHTLHLIDSGDREKEIAALPVKRRAWKWDRLVAGQHSTFYVAGGIDNDQNDIYVFEKQGETWKEGKGFTLTSLDPAGNAVLPDSP